MRQVCSGANYRFFSGTLGYLFEKWLVKKNNEKKQIILSVHLWSQQITFTILVLVYFNDRGTSQDSKRAAFCKCYGHLHELRSLAPKVKMVALTATATKLTKDTIQNVLLMENLYEITESPNKPNITYAVEYMQKDTEHELYFGWLADELRTRQSLCEGTIIYCQTIKQCGIIYATIKGLLGQHMYIGNNIDPRHVLVEMLHSCTPAANKQYILHSFQSEMELFVFLLPPLLLAWE